MKDRIHTINPSAVRTGTVDPELARAWASTGEIVISFTRPGQERRIAIVGRERLAEVLDRAAREFGA